MLICDSCVEVHLDYSVLLCFTYKYLRTSLRWKCQMKGFCIICERKSPDKVFFITIILSNKCLMKCRIARSVIECFTSFIVKIFYSYFPNK